MAAVLFGIDQGILPEIAILVGLFGPAIIAMAFTAIEKDSRVTDLLAQYLRFKAPLKVYLVALFTAPVLLFVSQQAAALVINDVSWSRFSLLTAPQLVIIPLISIGEELGWRGYLQPRLRRYFSLGVTSALVGIVWALWHLPGYYFNKGVVEGVSFLWFGAWVVSGAMVMGWLYERSHSVFIAILFHTSVNACFNIILIMPSDSGSVVPFQIFVLLVALIGILLTTRSSKGSTDPSKAGAAA